MLELLLVLLPLSAAAPPPTQDAWRWERLPLPASCRAPGEAAGPAPLEDGRHIRLAGDGDERDAAARPAAPRLPTAVLADLLVQDARSGGASSRSASTGELRVLLPAPPLIAGGSSAALERARAICADLDAQAQRERIRLEAWLTPAVERPGGAILAPDDAAGAASGDGPPLWVAEASPGDMVQFGQRLEHAFLSTFQAEVASGSEIADPVFGTALSGRTLHLRAWRVDGGAGLLVEGFLDLSHLAGLETVDTGSPDLGELQRPLVDSVQVRFGGRVENGGALRVTIQGGPLPAPDATLLVRASTAPATPPGNGDDVTWRMADVSLLEQPVRAASAGALRAGGPGRDPRTARGAAPVLLEALGAHALAGQVLGAGSARAAVPPMHLTTGAILAPTSAQAFWESADGLIRAAEGARAATALLVVERGDLRVGLPVAGVAPCRVQVGRERTWLVDYDPQIAPDSWLAAPRVVAGFEGLDLFGNWVDGVFTGGWSSARDLADARLERRATTHGRVELVARGLRGDGLRIRAGEAAVLAPEGDGDPGLAVRLARP